MPAGIEDGALALAQFGRARTALLTTFRRNGNPISTPVSVAIHAGRAYFVTADDSGKARRLAGCSRVRLVPCTAGGIVRGETVSGEAQLLEGAARRRVRRLLRPPTGPLFWSHLLYRAQGKTMNLYEIALALPEPDIAPAMPSERRCS